MVHRTAVRAVISRALGGGVTGALASRATVAAADRAIDVRRRGSVTRVDIEAGPASTSFTLPPQSDELSDFI